MENQKIALIVLGVIFVIMFLHYILMIDNDIVYSTPVVSNSKYVIVKTPSPIVKKNIYSTSNSIGGMYNPYKASFYN